MAACSVAFFLHGNHFIFWLTDGDKQIFVTIRRIGESKLSGSHGNRGFVVNQVHIPNIFISYVILFRSAWATQFMYYISIISR